jgi:hypothetical protein
MARQAAARDETGDEVVGGGAVDSAEIRFSAAQSLVFVAGGSGAAEGDRSNAPTESILVGAKRQKKGKSDGGKLQDEPLKELIAALLEEFPHCNEKQAQSALLATQQLCTAGKPGWKLVAAAKLMPPAPPGAPGNPIYLLSSGSSDTNSPEQVLEDEAKVERIKELALASKLTWCRELNLSLGVEEAHVSQVFDCYQPRTLDTLEAFVVGELAEELEMQPDALLGELRKHEQARAGGAGCNPGGPQGSPRDDDEADDVGRRAQSAPLTQGGAAAGARGQVAPLPGNTSTFGGRAAGEHGSSDAEKQPGGSGTTVECGASTVSGTVYASDSGTIGGRRVSSASGALGAPGNGTNGARVSDANKAPGGGTAGECGAGTASGAVRAPDGDTVGGRQVNGASGALKAPGNGPHDTHGTHGVSDVGIASGGGTAAGHGVSSAHGAGRTDTCKLRLTPAALKILLELQNGEREVPQPLEAKEFAVQITELRLAAIFRLGGTLSDVGALAALEVARHLPRASGWPSCKAALSCLERRGTTPRRDTCAPMATAAAASARGGAAMQG